MGAGGIGTLPGTIGYKLHSKCSKWLLNGLAGRRGFAEKVGCWTWRHRTHGPVISLEIDVFVIV